VDHAAQNQLAHQNRVGGADDGAGDQGGGNAIQHLIEVYEGDMADLLDFRHPVAKIRTATPTAPLNSMGMAGIPHDL
jgi:hypothetical protein